MRIGSQHGSVVWGDRSTQSVTRKSVTRQPSNNPSPFTPLSAVINENRSPVNPQTIGHPLLNRDIRVTGVLTIAPRARVRARAMAPNMRFDESVTRAGAR